MERHSVRELLVPFTSAVYARFGHPVYLVGSALFKPLEETRDVDVVCILPDEEFNNRFAVVHWTDIQSGKRDAGVGLWRWAGECSKISRWTSAHYSGLNLDFKVQSDDWANHFYTKKPRLRLDRVEELDWRD